MTRSFLAAVLLTATAPAAWAGGNAEAGKTLFKRCAFCHQVGPSARAGFAPHLNGLFGRSAGSTPDYAYSPAMKASGIVWTEETLTAFLHDPGKAVPGNKMRFWGLSNEQQIADLLAYLRTFQAVNPANRIDR